MKEVYIISAIRTPIGSFGGVLAGLTAVQLGSKAIRGALQKAGVDPGEVDEVYFGNVCSANLGQAPARQAALGAGIPSTVPCTTINKVCASGAKAIMLGAQNIILGYCDVVVAGGMESMSNVPFYIPKARWGYKYGNGELIDGLAKDGLLDAYDQQAMGVFADKTAEFHSISREAQDAFTIRSYQRTAETSWSGKFKDEIVAVEVPQRKGEALVISEDEEYKNVNFEKIPSLRPAFTKEGTVTAANASTINDGAAAVILMSKEKMQSLRLKPMARIVSFADAEQEPQWFTTSPAKAAPIALKRGGLTLKDVDFFEVNEAFAVVPLVFNQLLDVDPEKVNVFGGAVSLGHPLGASGARIVTTLNNILQHSKGKIGLASICNGGGGASSIVIEKA